MIALKALARNGSYPSFEIRRAGHLYLPREDLTWSAVVQPSLPADWEVGEFTPLSPEQVALFASIALSERDPWNNGVPLLTHGVSAFADPAEVGADLRDSTTIGRLNEIICATIATERRLGAAAPSEEYLIRSVGSKDDAEALLDNVDTGDQLLLAGLARYLGACRLLATSHELEEAAVSLFVSMGAALEFIRQSIGKDGEDVSFNKVSEYLRTTFPDGDAVAEYFEEMYENRVIAIHPSNRFGDFWAIPLMVDDVFWLRNSLIALYRYILLGDLPDADST